jgi:hypothetical protein
MKLYRIYTENKQRQMIEQEVRHYFNAFTMYEAKGFWKGTREKTLVIEITSSKNNSELKLIDCLCKAIKTLNNQECVLFTVQEVKVQFI